MMMTRHLTTIALGLGLGLLIAAAPPAAAQGTGGMTEAEISEAFARQKTRGLAIAPSSQVQQGSGATTTVAAAPADYAQIPVEEQVNINISFDFDSSALRADQKPKLVALCNVMKSADVELFRIVGHTDSAGSDAYNERLSLLRAEEVKRHLVSDCGIAADRLQPVGVGSRFLFDPQNPRGDVNRRVEFQALG